MAVSKGWVVFLDIFGFTAQLKSIKHHELHRKLTDCCDHIRRTVLYDKNRNAYKSYIYFYIFSDSIFLLYSTESGRSKEMLLREVISDTREVMGLFMKYNLPLRGGVAFGEVSHDKYLLRRIRGQVYF